MDLFRRAGKAGVRHPSPLPVSDSQTSKNSRPNKSLSSRIAFLRKPMRLRRSSTTSIPLGIVLLFPLTVVILILVLFLKHPSSPGRILMPAGAPPAIRYAACEARPVALYIPR